MAAPFMAIITPVGGTATVCTVQPIVPGAHPEHPIVYPPGPVDPGYGIPIEHPEHPIVIPPPPSEPPLEPGGGKPPPAEGGWGWFPPYGWGYFPGPGEAGPKK